MQIRLTDNGPLLSRLKRGTVLQPDGKNKPLNARSEALNALGSGLLFDKEVPREGVHITRRRRMVVDRRFDLGVDGVPKRDRQRGRVSRTAVRSTGGRR